VENKGLLVLMKMTIEMMNMRIKRGVRQDSRWALFPILRPLEGVQQGASDFVIFQ
jgi:hypothetical protein